ncbi:MAG TPA: ABC transporter permease [Saprospiraceae bacterium]|nr:ABC transporter permease [Saprospiraceae bacterium]
MNLSLLFARRYLFAKRSTNAINIITGISVVGVAIGTAALILVLSVFNGFEDLLSNLFGYFNPEVKVIPAKGKTFQPDSLALLDIRQLPDVAVLSETLEEIAVFEYDGSQVSGILKGVDETYPRVNDIDSTLREGEFRLQGGDRNFAVLGAGMRNKLSVNINNPLASLTIYMATDGSSSDELLPGKPFKSRIAYPAGTFAIQQEFDSEYVLTNLEFVRELLGASPRTVSALEIRCKPGANVSAVKKELRRLLGDSVVIKDRYEQNEAFFKVMRLEKWMGYAITSLMLILMAFNLVGALWMIVLDKQKDISVLKSMGADDRTVHRIFLSEGLLLTLLGLISGVVLAIVLYAVQKTWGIVTIPQGFLVESYPIAMRAADFIPVTLTVVGIGLLASLAPAARAVRVPSFLREE